MPQSNSESIDEKTRSLLQFLVDHEKEVRQLFGDKGLLNAVSDPFNIKIDKNVTLTNQVDEAVYDDFKDFCKNKKIKVKVALMRAMLDLVEKYHDYEIK
ncbi:hypothetical protein KJ966_24955 [bacterium]|nr:hypothetical protein [bacterium]